MTDGSTGSSSKLLDSDRQPRPARVPDGLRLYAVGDVHGRSDLLDQVLLRIDDDLTAHPIPRAIHVFLGDYIDRGPTSRVVLDRLIECAHDHEIVCLKGNHEVFLAEFLKEPTVLPQWQQYGGLETLMSYGLRPPTKTNTGQQMQLAAELERALPDTHRQFLMNLKSYFVCGDYLFVHAGVRPGVPLERQQDQDLLWIREDFLVHQESFEKFVIHGHTPVLKPEIHPNRINIDTGAYATGKLTCLMLEADKFAFI